MQIIQVLELTAVVGCIILAVMIYKWFINRRKICGNTDLLCYITGKETNFINGIQNIF